MDADEAFVRKVRLAALPLALLGALVLACTSSGAEQTPSATSILAASPSATALSPTATPTPTATPDLVRWGEPDSTFRVLVLEARTELPADPSRVVQLPEPVSPFPDPGRDTEQTLLYDFATGEVETLGPSHWGGGRFSADGQYLVWLTQTGVERFVMHIRDTQTGDEREVEVTRPLFAFVGEHEVLVGERLIDLATGVVRTIATLPGGTGIQYESGLLLRSELLDKSGGDYTRRFIISRGIEDRPLVAVEGWLAAVVDSETVAVMSEPVDGLASIHLLNIETQETEFITTARQPFPGDLEGGGSHVAWIENACQVNEAQTDTLGRLRIWDRESGRISEYGGTSFVAEVDDGRLAIGGFGPKAWYDIESGDLIAAVPTSGELAGWSPDLRYASVGRLLGHGGRCQ